VPATYPRLPPGETPLTVVSPHLDDGVLGCGELLLAHPGSTLITVFAGRPERYGPLTEWDRASGFAEGDDVVAARWNEDRAACAHLGAVPRWLDYLDAQYAPSPSAQTIAEGLAAAIRAAGSGTVVAPLGIWHSDHRLAGDAARLVIVEEPGFDWFLYEDAGYRALEGRLPRRLAEVRASGLQLARRPIEGPEAGERKRGAIALYASQVPAMTSRAQGGYRNGYLPERYWPVRSRGGPSRS